MKLFVYTGAAVFGDAIVTSLASTTPITDFPQVMVGDSIPLVVAFTTGTIAETWSGDPTYSLTVGIGQPSSAGAFNYTSTSTFTAGGVSTQWTGQLNLNTALLKSAVDAALSQNFRAIGARLFFQIRVTDPAGNIVTYAETPIFVLGRIV